MMSIPMKRSYIYSFIEFDVNARHIHSILNINQQIFHENADTRNWHPINEQLQTKKKIKIIVHGSIESLEYDFDP